jgi:RND family efflux transporter MFP subunit
MKPAQLISLCLSAALAGTLGLPTASVAESIELDGLIEPFLIVKVGSAVPGILESVKVDRGHLVNKGQVLARLQARVEKANLALAKARAEMQGSVKSRQARLEYTQRKQQRMEELYKKKVIPFEEMDESRTNKELAERELEESLENIGLAKLEYRRSLEVVKRMTIRSPIEGVVMERFLAPGEYVEDQPILKIAQVDPLNVEIFAPVEFLGSIKVGMVANVQPMAPVGGTYTAKVKIVDRVVDAASGTFGVRLEIPNPNFSLPAGLRCKVIFPVN